MNGNIVKQSVLDFMECLRYRYSLREMLLDLCFVHSGYDD